MTSSRSYVIIQKLYYVVFFTRNTSGEQTELSDVQNVLFTSPEANYVNWCQSVHLCSSFLLNITLKFKFATMFFEYVVNHVFIVEANGIFHKS